LGLQRLHSRPLEQVVVEDIGEQSTVISFARQPRAQTKFE
jgi:hypothetical protein